MMRLDPFFQAMLPSCVPGEQTGQFEKSVRGRTSSYHSTRCSQRVNSGCFFLNPRFVFWLTRAFLWMSSMTRAIDWESIRAEYEAGCNQSECSRRHGVSRTAIQKRIEKEGWTQDVEPLLYR